MSNKLATQKICMCLICVETYTSNPEPKCNRYYCNKKAVRKNGTVCWDCKSCCLHPRHWMLCEDCHISENCN